MSKVYRLSLVVLLLAIIFLVWDGCSKDAQLSAYRNKMNKFRLKEQVFEETIDKNGKRIANQEQIILSQKDALKLAAKTWPKSVKQLVHYSSCQMIHENSEQTNKRAHADYIYEFIDTYGLALDIELETKAKELALIKYMKQ